MIDGLDKPVFDPDAQYVIEGLIRGPLWIWRSRSPPQTWPPSGMLGVLLSTALLLNGLIACCGVRGDTLCIHLFWHRHWPYKKDVLPRQRQKCSSTRSRPVTAWEPLRV